METSQYVDVLHSEIFYLLLNATHKLYGSGFKQIHLSLPFVKD